MKRILITTENYYPQGGGIQQFVRGFAEHLSCQGFEVFIYTKSYPDKYLSGEFELREGLVCYSGKMEGSMKNPFTVIKNKKYFSQYISEKNIDLVFANNHNSLAWIKAAKISQVPVIYGCHGVGLMDPFKRKFLMPDDEISWGFPSIIDSLRWWLKEDIRWYKKIILVIMFFTPFFRNEKFRNFWRYKSSLRILNSANARYANSSLTATLFNNRKNTFGFPLALNADDKNAYNYYYPDIDNGFLSKLGLKEKSYVLCSGRINYIKGQEYAIKAFKSVKNKNLKLVLAGNVSLFAGEKNDLGIYEKRLLEIIEKNNLKDRVVFTSFLNFEEMRKIYSGALVSVVPSVWLETFGYVTIESMACETPVIVTSNCGSAECVNDKTGFVVERKDDEAIGNIINNFREKEFIRMGKEARVRILNKYDWKVLGGKYIELMTYIYDKYKK